MRVKGIGIIILAAGASTRMGEPKQLLRVAGETLLSRAVRVALETRCYPLIVVLGAEADTLRTEITAPSARIVVNQVWAEGMGSSIRCGLRALQAVATDEIEAALLMLCDQPSVTSEVLGQLIAAYQARRPLLVAADYEANGERTQGVPAIFNRQLFPELLALRGVEGARGIVKRHVAESVLIHIPEAASDVDTPDDYLALIKSV